jgi:hypothetical protein
MVEHASNLSYLGGRSRRIQARGWPEQSKQETLSEKPKD